MATPNQNPKSPLNPLSPQPGNQAGGKPGAQQRSEGLLPAGKSDDGRFDVAEEVNADQQSDAMRHAGRLPESRAADDQLPDPARQSDG